MTKHKVATIKKSLSDENSREEKGPGSVGADNPPPFLAEGAIMVVARAGNCGNGNNGVAK